MTKGEIWAGIRQGFPENLPKIPQYEVQNSHAPRWLSESFDIPAFTGKNN